MPLRHFLTRHRRLFLTLRLAAIAVIIPLLAWYAHGQYTWNTTGKSTSQILSRLGPPTFITASPGEPASSFSYHYLGLGNAQYILHFQKDQVASVEVAARQALDIH